MTDSNIVTRSTALRLLGARAHLLDALPLVCDRDGSELGFFARDVEALKAGRYRHIRHAPGPGIERPERR